LALPGQRSAQLEPHSASPVPHSGPLPERDSGPDCCCRADPVDAPAVSLRLRGVAVLPEPARLSAWAARPGVQPGVSVRQARQRAEPGVSVQQARQRAQPRASAEQVLQRAELQVLAEPVLQPEARAASAVQAAALRLEGRDAAAVRQPAVDAAGAAPGARVVRQPEAPGAEAERQREARPALVAPVRDAAAALGLAWAAPDARALPWAVLSAWAFHPDRLRSAPAPPPAV
jgi:hypothetical protein